MRIVITGATGNVGSALLRVLRAAHQHELIGMARRPPGPSVSLPDIIWHAVDLTEADSGRELDRVFRNVDAVVHLAWGFQPSHRPDVLEELGVGGTRRVVAAALRQKVPHLVHMSSVGAYSSKVDDVPVNESYPTQGVPRSPYSSHKAQAERILDELTSSHPEMTVTRLRPGIIGQKAAGSALLRYGVPGFVPARLLGLVPVLPLDRALLIPMVHADDVADAIEQVLTRRAPGAFNLASGPAINADHIGTAFDAAIVNLPRPVLRGTVDAAWRARLLQLDPGWIDLAYAVPLLDTTRAERELGWAPTHSATAVLDEIVSGMTNRDHGPTPVLRRRTPIDLLARTLRHGPISRRREP